MKYSVVCLSIAAAVVGLSGCSDDDGSVDKVDSNPARTLTVNQIGRYQVQPATGESFLDVLSRSSGLVASPSPGAVIQAPRPRHFPIPTPTSGSTARVND